MSRTFTSNITPTNNAYLSSSKATIKFIPSKLQSLLSMTCGLSDATLEKSSAKLLTLKITSAMFKYFKDSIPYS